MGSDPTSRPPCVVTVAGSDSGGGAGIQADLKTFTALNVYGASVVTALTAQNTKGVQDIHIPPISFIEQQMESVLSDIKIAALKTGMLPSPAIIRSVAQSVRRYEIPFVVVDPVLVATSGDSLVRDDTRNALIANLFPIATVITPNLPEAEKLTEMRIESPSDVRRACETLIGMGCNAVLLKGGHTFESYLEDDSLDERIDASVASDILYDGKSFEVFSRPRVDTKNTHGTGCTLSAAITAFLAQGKNMRDAVAEAKTFVFRGIQDGIDVGQGNGPLNHMHAIPEYNAYSEVP
ncbi:Hydroxymethylpyrimidine/phosphomethylpyrimidine kinase [Gracilariopsis chorda]|uniref:Hydroxymethylpyrimidine/phosphomethylpyrimidine kinase n=1 Tax=Gracilariopsis chorda TaxID=448386 RepID=A0A2V3IH73_9FLOR|nr:Hydroxymethylpyrimidine/phosphomethylpyrimidine kinase [Gracilariopsis chorda]|eukprot:PXF41388.1 Hydroxymethylpyrimidine/phosphomethylpyrimidine kinase [Gracilariopsis chorda]